MITIPFHPRFTEAIEEGTKRFTLRVDPGYDPVPGDPLELVDGDREPITGATCKLNAEVPAAWIPQWKFLGHREYEDLEALIEELAEYYPDHDIDQDTPITVIGW
ncbi:hypothetical protein HHTV1_74 [Haloarcula hispanica tailed virus 1]|uniref:ASCH domain-containing protein n=1 Tax=Haloarcula hispanica tailed virus 1 TaxID=1273750 RepID=R4TKX6_9CAUD|nr:hypothetical protein M198_gp74 [Haloarcula hispanica tailed virus 1]AGM11327.1 hypothetical protein HHTV1_74 [Haloarcula hispanica tailed virus 1]